MLQSSGPISLLDLKTEFSDTDPVNLGDYYRGGALNTSASTNVPTSGAISLGMFYGLSAVTYFNLNQTISADTNRYNLQAQLINAGWNGVDIVNATITINANIVVYSDDTAIPALSIPNTIPDGSIININNNGYIIGMGGAGGGFSSTLAGKAGGPALSTQKPVSITNNGTIGGGGGGGGSIVSGGTFGGGGGRTGRVNSIGGTSSSGQGGQPGTFTSAGEGSGNITGGTNAGGDWGFYGKSNGIYAGGIGGAAVIGNSNITWIKTGTRLGGIT